MNQSELPIPPSRTKNVLTPAEIMAISIAEKEAKRRKLPMPRACEGCGEIWTPLHATAFYCSDKCRMRVNRAKPHTASKCEQCGNPITNPHANQRFCRDRCRAAHHNAKFAKIATQVGLFRAAVERNASIEELIRICYPQPQPVSEL